MAAYPQLDTLIQAYFNQDAGYIADSFEGLVADYVGSHRREDCAALRRDIAGFTAAHAADLDAAFEATYGFDVDPVLWGYDDAAAFLRAVVALLPA